MLLISQKPEVSCAYSWNQRGTQSGPMFYCGLCCRVFYGKRPIHFRIHCKYADIIIWIITQYSTTEVVNILLNKGSLLITFSTARTYKMKPGSDGSANNRSIATTNLFLLFIGQIGNNLWVLSSMKACFRP